MYCPGCRDEFRPEILVCPDCDLSLVSELPALPEPRNLQLICVYKCHNSALLPVAESLLIDAGINYTKSSDRLQDLFAGGQIGVGFNPVIGAVGVWVDEEDSREAFELLSRLADTQESPN